MLLNIVRTFHMLVIQLGYFSGPVTVILFQDKEKK